MSNLRHVLVSFYGLPLEISGEYFPGSPGSMYKRNSDPGDPPEDAEFDFHTITFHGHDMTLLFDDFDGDQKGIYRELEDIVLQEIEEQEDYYPEDEDD